MGSNEQNFDRTRARKRRRLMGTAGALLVLLFTGASVWAILALRQDAPPSESPVETSPALPSPSPQPEPEPTPEPEPEPEPVFDLDSPASLTVVVNKQRPLNPIDWAPSDLVWPDVPNSSGHPLRESAASALEEMYAAAAAEGVPFTITSGYRPYEMQVSLFESYAQRDGVEAAERYSARAGFSEHQTGLAADLDDGSGCAFLACFGETPAGLWLRDNAHRFGFILRYHDGEERTVGYLYEPWHFRYIGAEVSGEMHERGILNLEDHFGLPAAPGY